MARSTEKSAPIPISPSEEARIAENKAFVLENMPDMLPFIRELHAEGLIDGWRAVTSCKLITESKS